MALRSSLDSLDSARMAGAIIDAAHQAPTLCAWQGAVFEILAPVGFDVALFESKAPASRAYSASFDRRVIAAARWDVYERELLPLARAAQGSGGVAVDSNVLGGARERCAYHRELVRPHRGSHSLIAYLGVARASAGGLMLGRAGSAFRDAELGCVRALVPSLSVGLAAQLTTARAVAAAAKSAAPLLTGREREVLDQLCRGLTNPEIARALGSSPNTVRNQVASLFAKHGATTRSELVAIHLGAL
jgi:DNA-binding CsgD family transcriptional regulator